MLFFRTALVQCMVALFAIGMALPVPPGEGTFKISKLSLSNSSEPPQAVESPMRLMA